eukprot:scaffold7371_cov121-Isochrysis_galbana.AAC.3
MTGRNRALAERQGRATGLRNGTQSAASGGARACRLVPHRGSARSRPAGWPGRRQSRLGAATPTRAGPPRRAGPARRAKRGAPRPRRMHPTADRTLRRGPARPSCARARSAPCAPPATCASSPPPPPAAHRPGSRARPPCAARASAPPQPQTARPAGCARAPPPPQPGAAAAPAAPCRRASSPSQQISLDHTYSFTEEIKQLQTLLTLQQTKKNL